MIENILLLLGCAHGFYLIFSLLHHNNKDTNANRVLALLVGGLVFSLFVILLDESELLLKLPHFAFLNDPIIFIFGPLLLLYVQKLTSPTFVKVKALHFLPFVAAILLASPFYLSSGEYKLNFSYGEMPQDVLSQQMELVFNTVFPLVAVVQLAVYLWFVFKQLSSHRKNIENNFSNIEKINLNWLTRLCVAITVLFALWILDEVIELNTAACIDFNAGLLCNQAWLLAERPFYFCEMGVIVCVYLMSFYGLKQPLIFTPSPPGEAKTKEIPIEVEEQKKQKYQNSSLTEELAVSVFSQLSGFVVDEQPHLDCDLSLETLAQNTGISRHHLSQAINQCAEQNFFDYINSLRVMQAKKLLQGEDKMTVLDVSLAAGFNSRSSFYSAFKKHTEMTPSQYRRSLN